MFWNRVFSLKMKKMQDPKRNICSSSCEKIKAMNRQKNEDVFN